MIDAHCHLDLYRDPLKVAREAERKNVLTVAVTNLPSHFAAGRPHVRDMRRVRLALGLHPLLADRHSPEEFRSFRRLLSKTSYVGEVGLDRSREGSGTFSKQLASFRFVLDAMGDTPRFLTLHSRRAESEVLELLAEYAVSRAVFHWYSGPASLVDEIVSAGHYLSVNPAMVRSKKGQKILERTPRDRVLTETDGPHLQVGRRPAEPADVAQVLIYLTKIWGSSPQETERRVRSNLDDVLDPVRRWPETLC